MKRHTEVSLRPLEEASVQQAGTAWQANDLDYLIEWEWIWPRFVQCYIHGMVQCHQPAWLMLLLHTLGLVAPSNTFAPVAQSNQNLKLLIALICVQSNSALALLKNQAAFAECQADFSAPELPGENLQDEPPATIGAEWLCPTSP